MLGWPHIARKIELYLQLNRGSSYSTTTTHPILQIYAVQIRRLILTLGLVIEWIWVSERVNRANELLVTH